MRRKTRIYKIIFTLCLLSFFNFRAEALKLYLLSNHDNVGDHQQALGILSAFQKLSKKNISFEDINTKTSTASDIKNKVLAHLLREKVIVVGTGEGGLDGIADLQANENLTICLSSHMILTRYKEPALLQKVTFIALPTHVAEEVRQLLGNKLIETIGVAHNRQGKAVDKVYQKWGKKALPKSQTYLGVVLGGDAPVPGSKNQIRLFTENDARQLAFYVARQAGDACVLILNGPRTGKYDSNQKEILTVHRKGYADRITDLFREELVKHGVSNIKVLDFQYNTPENKNYVLPYNSSELVLGALRAKKGELIVPGESTSAISEAVDTLPFGKVVVYENNAMNDTHKAHLQSELKAGRISILKNYQEMNSPSIPSKSRKTAPNAASLIAQKLREAMS